jgi:hypothetical protein
MQSLPPRFSLMGVSYLYFFFLLHLRHRLQFPIFPAQKSSNFVHSSLDKDFNTVYLVDWSFFAWP